MLTTLQLGFGLTWHLAGDLKVRGSNPMTPMAAFDPWLPQNAK